MLTLDGTALAAITASVREVCYLVECDFSSGILRATTYATELTSGGNVYQRLGNALTISRINESEDTDTSEIQLQLAVADPTLLALAIGDATVYRGRAVRIYLQMLQSGVPQGAAVKRWSGYMTKTSVERTKKSNNADGTAPGGVVRLNCARAGLARVRRNEGLRITHAQHLLRYPGDMGYEYIAGLIEKPTRWLSRPFQEQGVR
jgi:hypothetical protein